ncbi:MAG TPA: hypothetical protein VNJ28_02525 [Candidatus Limnocylindrales bacterium]|nr:hypothetical protein [Candidatus Limnocylindrales bacterium]
MTEEPVTLSLTRAELDLLADILDGDFRDLRDQIYRVEDYRFEQELKEREALLRSILDKLASVRRV